jgi:hypothetical protein
MTDQDERDDGVADLGAASEVTQGVWDPMLKENHIMPQSRDF